MSNRPTILVATTNHGKAGEFAALLPFEVELVTLRDFGLESPEENGATFLENARIKALSASAASGLLTIADDSGICVDALHGAPGRFSARFAGENATDAENRRKLLELLTGIAAQFRGAHFQASIVVAHNNTIIAEGTGRTDGAIALEERGKNGFGYDPIFLLPDGRTMAELDSGEKNEISHRSRATKLIVPALASALRQTVLMNEGTR